ncbi:hypothetical protein IFM89_021086 [Coptis chinensis]|uniref:Uncharacterized protein n=1 Tax=Coptis chinensis TaxID=261450 RepID=A0A835HYZ3_9MAGN|nr:hypothetical protein IFM89_021086 [Coptis chinensis]
MYHTCSATGCVEALIRLPESQLLCLAVCVVFLSIKTLVGCVGSRSYSGEVTVRRKRSKTSRWPLSEPFPVSHDVLSLPSMPMSHILRNVSSNENNGCNTGPHKKEFNINQCVLNFSCAGQMSTVGDLDKRLHRIIGNLHLQLEKFGANIDNTMTGDCRTSGYSDGLVNEYKLRKVKLRVGDITRTIHTNSAEDGTCAGELKPSCSLDA